MGVMFWGVNGPGNGELRSNIGVRPMSATSQHFATFACGHITPHPGSWLASTPRDDKSVNPVQPEGHVWANIRLFRRTSDFDLVVSTCSRPGQDARYSIYHQAIGRLSSPISPVTHRRMMGAVNMVSNQRAPSVNGVTNPLEPILRILPHRFALVPGQQRHTARTGTGMRWNRSRHVQ